MRHYAFFLRALLILGSSSMAMTRVFPSLSPRTINITVGKNTRNAFDPEVIIAAPNDSLRFSFWSGTHSVARSDFDQPCGKYSGDGEDIFSGSVKVVGEGAQEYAAMAKSFYVIINDTDPIWIYCSIGNHCRDGQVMVVNPPYEHKDQSLLAYKQGAHKSAVLKHKGIKGGVWISHSQLNEAKTMSTHSMHTSQSYEEKMNMSSHHEVLVLTPTHTMMSLSPHNMTASTRLSNTGTAEASETPKVFDGGADGSRLTSMLMWMWVLLGVMVGIVVIG